MIREPFVRNPYNYDVDDASNEAGFASADPSRAKQSFREECDINTIVRRFRISGELPSNVRMPTYGDFTGVGDFRTAMEAIRMAHESFDEMPAEIRAKFHNDPAEFVDFCSNEANRDEAVKMGLVPPKQAAAAASLVAAPPPATPPAPPPTEPVKAPAQ